MSIYFGSNDAYRALMAECIAPAESCGLCEQGRGDTYWPTQESRWAHNACVQKISPAIDLLTRTIRSLLPQNQSSEHIQARARAIHEIKKHCSPMTIIEYANQEGIDKVTELFNSTGREAVQHFKPAKL